MSMNRRLAPQDISWFLDLNRNEQIDLDPPYQRRSVWSPRDRRFFLDTIFRGYPSPSVFLHKEIIDGNTIYAVIDGKQRLETIFMFTRNEIALPKDYGDARLDGKKWATIQRDITLAKAFWNYVIPVEFIDVSEGDITVNDMFDRLNRNARRLVEQELRHAKFEGWLISYVESEADDPDWETLAVVTTARRKRMSEVQILSELLIVILKNDIAGFDQELISEYYADYEEPTESVSGFDEKDIISRFEKAKKYLVQLEQEGELVTKYARDLTNLYSLWSIVALNSAKLPEAKIFIDKYSDFIDEVNKYKDEKYFRKVQDGKVQPTYPESLTYYRNMMGARTEEPQRRARDKALQTVMFNGSKS